MAHEATAEPVAPAPAAEPEPSPTTLAAEPVALGKLCQAVQLHHRTIGGHQARASVG